MTLHPRIVLVSCAVAIVTTVNATAVALGPEHRQLILLLSAALAVLAAVQCAAWDPALLTWALAFSLPPVIALTADGSPSWLIGPLGAMLLVAAELNALGWELYGPAPALEVTRRRLRHIGLLGGLGVVASLLVGAVALAPSPGGLAAVVAGAVALAGVGRVLFARGG